MIKEMKMWFVIGKKSKASLTVEAAFLVPLMILFLAGILQFSFWLHDHVLAQSAAVLGAMQEMERTKRYVEGDKINYQHLIAGKSQESEQEVENAAQKYFESGKLGKETVTFSLSENFANVEVLFKGKKHTGKEKIYASGTLQLLQLVQALR